MFVAEIERRSGLSRDTLRFYERRGLITPPVRMDNGYRRYDAHTLAELKFIDAAQSVGFTLEEIRQAIPKLKAPPAQCAELLAALHARRSAVKQEMAALRERSKRLDRLIERFS
jgi:DNA-binding transcriptional MerR regulator